MKTKRLEDKVVKTNGLSAVFAVIGAYFPILWTLPAPNCRLETWFYERLTGNALPGFALTSYCAL